VTKSSISGLRSKIGAAPMRELVERCCVPMADAQAHPHAFYAGLRLVAIDGSTFELPDEADNVAHFGYPGSRTGHAGYPQAQCVVLVECATHAILGANLGPYRSGEWEIFQPLLPRLKPGMLCMADRGFNGFEHWRQAQATGAQLLWRCVGNRQLPVHRMLDDGSYLSAIYPTGVGRSEAAAQAIVVRVVEYALPGLDDAQPRYRLLTTLLDPQIAGAGTGSAVPPALGDRGRLRRAQDPPQAEPTRAAQQDRGARAPGVLWLGAGALLGALAVASRLDAPSNTARRAILHRACAASSPRTAPLRGLSPQSAPGVDDDGSMNCSQPAPKSAPRAR